jgi:predicted RNase H-like HicB family nuclease
VPIVPGALAYGATRAEAAARAEALVLRALAERIEHGEPVPEIAGCSSGRSNQQPLLAPATKPP